MVDKKIIHLLGYASGLAGVNSECGLAPFIIQQSIYLQQHVASGQYQWDTIYQPSSLAHLPERREEEIQDLCQQLGRQVAMLVEQQKFFLVLGGDHSSAIGTWSGAYTALHQQGPVGLIWIDAHMDSHVPETSVSGRIHGMPLASLLGYGKARFTQLLSSSPKLNPQQVCLIGVRSYEGGEAEFLKQLNVRVFFIDEVKKRGLSAVFDEAKAIVTRNTAGYGVSLDIDSLDPKQVPGVDVPEPDGIAVQDILQQLKIIGRDSRLIGAEIVEFSPNRDINQITEKIVAELIVALGDG
jgi:arginase